MELLKYDMAVIGAGSGGLSVAAGAAQLGAKVVLIEHRKMGGDCLNYGCIPSKSLLASAKAANIFSTAERFGIASTKPSVDFTKVMNQVAEIIKTIAPNDSVERFTQLGVDVIHDNAKFIDKQKIAITDKHIWARRIVIATGSTPAIPPISGLNHVQYLTNETIFELKEKPDHLIIIGGGPMGCEMAQAFHSLGCEVTVLQRSKILPKDEADLVQILRLQFTQEGIHLHEDTQINRITNINNRISVEVVKAGVTEVISGSHLLLATGRQANLAGLDLHKAGVEVSHNAIVVDERLRTTNKYIYAIGDVINQYQFTHMANYHAGIVIKNALFRLPTKVNYKAVPWVTYCSPELAHVGLSSEEALKQDKTVNIIVLPLTENDRAHTDRETTGQIKIITTRKGKVLGASILAAHAGELILPWIMLIQHGKSLRNLTDVIVPYPTLNEISKRAASAFYAPLLFSNKVRCLVKFLKIFG